MNTKEYEVKVKWFQHQTGCSDVEARKFLKIAKWKIKNAIIERDKHWKEIYEKNVTE